MESLLILLPIPLVIGLIGLLVGKGKITLKEYLAQEVVIIFIIGIGCLAANQFSMRDTEVWSGKIIDKQKVTVSCQHSYTVIVGYDNKGNPIYATYYEHFRDYDWVIETSNNEIIRIQRVDRQGVTTPPRWDAARIGEPTALTHVFSNYIKANPWTILKQQGQLENFKKLGLIPDYPIKVQDYYHIDRFLDVKVGIPFSEYSAWNKELSQINAELGKNKEVNIIIAAVNTKDSAYLHALEEAWLGGKQNDLVIILGVTQYPQIDWVRIMSWTKVEILKVVLRDNIAQIGDITERSLILGVIKREIDEKFIRTPMAEFAYLRATLQPPFWLMIAFFVLGAGASAGLSIYFWKEDPFKSRGG